MVFDVCLNKSVVKTSYYSLLFFKCFYKSHTNWSRPYVEFKCLSNQCL